MLFIYTIKTDKENFHAITPQVRNAVKESGVESGICMVYCPHTTAGITINENADPDVVRDILTGLRTAFPDQAGFRHTEGNSVAHLKSSCIGASKNLIIENHDLLLGTWQEIYFCEFDGPRTRKFHVKILDK